MLTSLCDRGLAALKLHLKYRGVSFMLPFPLLITYLILITHKLTIIATTMSSEVSNFSRLFYCFMVRKCTALIQDGGEWSVICAERGIFLHSMSLYKCCSRQIYLINTKKITIPFGYRLACAFFFRKHF